MKAHKVKKLDPEGTFAENVERIMRVRLGELEGFMPAAADPDKVKPLHNMRIAAKRVRYVLEVAEPAYGSVASDGIKAMKNLQEVLGEIHDCDELLPRIRRRQHALRSDDATALRELGGKRKDLPPAVGREAPHRSAYRGIETLAVYIEARRALLFDRFLEHWREWEENERGTKLLAALADS